MHCIPHSHLASDPSHPDLNSASTDETHDHHINETTTENAPHVIGIGNQEGKVDVAGKGGEIPAWESCGKVVALERAGYGEFVVSLHIRLPLLVETNDIGHTCLTCKLITSPYLILSAFLCPADAQTTNTLFLIVSLFILMLRANKLAAVQYRALAAKIGIGGSIV